MDQRITGPSPRGDTFAFSCPGCSARYRVGEERRGKRTRCLKSGLALVAEEPARPAARPLPRRSPARGTLASAPGSCHPSRVSSSSCLSSLIASLRWAK
jgi:hypothetical protein